VQSQPDGRQKTRRTSWGIATSNRLRSGCHIRAGSGHFRQPLVRSTSFLTAEMIAHHEQGGRCYLMLLIRKSFYRPRSDAVNDFLSLVDYCDLIPATYDGVDFEAARAGTITTPLGWKSSHFG
jgi:hypothetical protein